MTSSYKSAINITRVSIEVLTSNLLDCSQGASPHIVAGYFSCCENSGSVNNREESEHYFVLDAEILSLKAAISAVN